MTEVTDSISKRFDKQIPLPRLVPSRWQPRQAFDPELLLELARHVADHGLIYPVLVFKNESGAYELVAGERRTRALAALALVTEGRWTDEHGTGLRPAIAHLAEHGWNSLDQDLQQDLVTTTVPARVYPSATGADLQGLHELAVADNLQRRNLSPIEEARALHGLIEAHGLTQRDVARRVGWSQSKVAQRLSLLNLAPEVREAVSTRVLSTSHARHLGRLPRQIQPAVTQHVEHLVDRDGDQAATVRQVAAFTQQLRRFLNPDHWLPPPDTPILPVQRNNLRLVRHHLQSADLEAHGEDIVRLRSSDPTYYRANLLGKKPLNLTDPQLVHVLSALTGEDRPLDKWWAKLAPSEGWTCDHCGLNELQPPAGCSFSLPCRRWKKAEDPPPSTCRPGFIGPQDPFLIAAGADLHHWAQKLDLADHLVAEPFPHFTAYAAWRETTERATRAAAEQRAQAKSQRDTEHVRQIAAYWQQQDGGPFAGVDHFQAHLCPRCVHYRRALLEQDLPPCNFAVDPIPNRYGSGVATAPDFAVLVREDGLAVPRCAHYHVSIVAIAPTPGYRLPSRSTVVGRWLHDILVGRNTSTRSYAMPGPLAWLPYPRPQPWTVHDLDGLLRYVKMAWDALGDECVATLLTVAGYEVAARDSYRGPMTLMDPTTLQLERWADVGWSRLLERTRPHGYPDDWPAPWTEEKL